ncbi:MAG: AzlC family ABC transporter permease [Clostridia bacterium]|nr:AzlC family ABC transporter permease [Clostridia bacterium]
MTKFDVLRKAFKSAFPYTIPIFAGFWFLGMAYGIYMKVSGFSFWYTLLMTVVIFGGSLEFVTVSMLLSPFAPLQSFIMALLIQARHLFYGLAMLDKYKGMGWKRFYLIFGLCDETFSINCSVDAPEGVDKGWFMFFVTLLNQTYWVTGSTMGAVLGSFIRFNTEGLDFVMTAMFVVIFLEQLMKEKKHYTAIIGVGASVLCRLIFGADSFMIPTMILILCMLWAFRKPLERSGGLE